MFSDLLPYAKILIVDDEMVNVRLLEKILTREGYVDLAMTTDPRRALPMFNDDQPDLVLLDLNMPHLTGYEVMEALAKVIPEDVFVPIIVLTADATLEAKQRALAAGATDFICKPFDNVEVALRIKNVLRTRFLHRQLEGQNRLLDERVRERNDFLKRTVLELQKAQQKLAEQS